MRRRGWRGLAIVAITALPVLLLSPFPTQDGPSHLYGGYVLSHLHDIHYPTINHAFAYSPSATSTWTVHWIVSILLGIVPAPWAEKLIVLSFVAWLFAVFIFGADNDEPPFFPLCVLPLFVMSFVLRMGFYSFCLSMPLAIHAVSAWAAGGMDVGKKKLILAGGLLALLPLFHLLAAGWAFALMGACSVGSVVTGRRTSIRELGILALSACPLLAVVAGYPAASPAYTWERLGARVAALVAGGAFVGEGAHALWWSSVPSVMLLALGVLFLRHEVRGAVSGNREALRRVVVVVAALLLALVVPEEEGAGGAYIGVRCNLLFCLLLLFLLRTWRLPARVDAAFSLGFLVFSVVHLSSTYATLKPASTAEREISASAALLRDHTTALVVVAGEWVDAASPTLATQVRPLLHAGDLLGVGADRTIWTFYEGEFPLFPVNFKRDTTALGVLFDRRLFGWEAPVVRWDAVPTWQGGVEYVGVWDERRVLVSSSGAQFRDAMCGHYEEVYRSDSRPWVIYRLLRGKDGGYRMPTICRP